MCASALLLHAIMCDGVLNFLRNVNRQKRSRVTSMCVSRTGRPGAGAGSHERSGRGLAKAEEGGS